MAKAAMLSKALLVVFLLMMEATSMAYVTASVNIYNEIQRPDPIQVDCSRDLDHMVPKGLVYGQKFGWDVKYAYTVRNVKYFCQFVWGIRIQTVRVWVTHGPCDRVEWHVRRDGFYRTCPDSEFGDAPVLRRVDIPKVPMATVALDLMALLVVMKSASMASASPADVNVYNMLTKPITLHCQSGDRDLRPVTLQGNSNYFGWGFSPSIWGRTLIYFCNFIWRNKHQTTKNGTSGS